MAIIQNDSHLPSRTFRKMLDFILKREPLACMARFDFAMSERQGMTTGGMAYLENPDIPFDRIRPSLVRLWVRHEESVFPRYDQHVKEVPGAWLMNLEEEVFLVLAHECVHIRQFWCLIRPTDELQAEIEAETIAIRLLQEWRYINSTQRKAA